MMTAKDAREKSRNAVAYMRDHELEMAMAAIEKNAGNGEFSVLLRPEDIHSEAMEALKELGYDVKVFSGFGQDSVRVRW